ncbi:hypothetical protein MUB24_13165 [Lederbergia sp. NSJ-179]|uniref:hypothetical protein n=1 Tax=Lederbergia sp. NSJ-179 TaxID=2931402 RepID=UPI001FD008E2|nr:hypothetical protein [Lederbergia sp. NSJ-179]MCJ7841831.1 hypothetical protein [Lederbergia sp. NSJ-179]
MKKMITVTVLFFSLIFFSFNFNAFAATNLTMTYNATTDTYSASGSNNIQEVYINNGPTNVSNGNTVYANNYLTNKSSENRAFLYKVGWDPNKMNFTGVNNITRCHDVTSYTVSNVDSTHVDITVYYGEPTTSDLLYPGEEGCSQVVFNWTGGGGTYNWRTLDGNSTQFITGERAGTATLAHFSSSSTVIMN